jgi:hypothetical protein
MTPDRLREAKIRTIALSILCDCAAHGILAPGWETRPQSDYEEIVQRWMTLIDTLSAGAKDVMIASIDKSLAAIGVVPHNP